MYQLFMEIIQAPELNLGIGAVISGLLGLLAWFVRSWLLDMKREMRELRIAVDNNSKVVTVALLEFAALIPGARPILEEAKRSAEERMRHNQKPEG